MYVHMYKLLYLFIYLAICYHRLIFFSTKLIRLQYLTYGESKIYIYATISRQLWEFRKPDTHVHMDICMYINKDNNKVQLLHKIVSPNCTNIKINNINYTNNHKASTLLQDDNTSDAVVAAGVVITHSHTCKIHRRTHFSICYYRFRFTTCCYWAKLVMLLFLLFIFFLFLVLAVFVVVVLLIVCLLSYSM